MLKELTFDFGATMPSDGNRIFVGIKINERLRDHLDAIKAFSQPSAEDRGGEDLQVLRIDDDEYFGRETRSGASIENLNNVFMNVKTTLKMTCPKYSFADDAIRFFALIPLPKRTLY
jgi:hypothetical protein